MPPIPAGWKLVPIEPTEEMLVALGGMGWMVQQKPENYAAMLAAAPSPASVAPGDAQAVAWMNPETQDVITNERKVSWLTTYGVGMAAKAAAYSQPLGVLAALAAGDALDAARYRWLRDADDRQRYEAEKWMAGYGPERLDAAIDAALAAQQQGEA